MKLFFNLLLFSCLLGAVHAQESITFQKPSAEILQLADYQRPPSVMMSPDDNWLVLSYRPTYKSLDELNQAEVRLAGLRINPTTNIASTTAYLNNIKIKRVGTADELQVKGLPETPRIASLGFSPDSRTLAFTNTTAKGVELWIVDLSSATAKRITDDDLNASMGTPYSWYRDSKSLLISKLPGNRPALIDTEKELPKGPIVSTSGGQTSQLRTYQDLLKTPQDEANFETLTQSELHLVDLQGKQTKLLDAAIYSQRSFSSDGNYLLVTTISRPFSYVVPYYNFPQKTSVFDMQGQLLKVVNETPLVEIMPKGFSSTRKGKRNMAWRADRPASLMYVEALDEGDASKDVAFRDEILSWDAPFNGQPESLLKVADRFASIIWGDKSNALVYTRWYDTRNEKIFLLNPTSKEAK